MCRIVTYYKHGLQVYKATISVGRTHRESVFMSEQGARDWMSRTIRSLR